MPHTIKGQYPGQYRPSKSRKPSGLSPVNESRENAQRRWNRLRQAVKRFSQIQRNLRTKGAVKRGRFTIKKASPNKKSASPPGAVLWKNVAPGVYFLSYPYQKGRFTVENIYGKALWPRTNARNQRN